jgi:hypothetical protein
MYLYAKIKIAKLDRYTNSQLLLLKNHLIIKIRILPDFYKPTIEL